jgi:hypothetical protein
VKRAVATALCFIGAADVAVAQSDTFTVKGIGNQSCGEWTSVHSGWSQDDKAKAAFQLSWVLGYLTGINEYVAQRPIDILDGVEHKALDAWMTSFCRSTPQSTIRAASQQLAGALSRHEVK